MSLDTAENTGFLFCEWFVSLILKQASRLFSFYFKEKMNNWRTTNEIKKALHKSAAYFQETKI